MEDAQQTAASSQCNGFRESTIAGNHRWKVFPVGRRTRGGFSDSFTSDAMASLVLEDEDAKNGDQASIPVLKVELERELCDDTLRGVEPDAATSSCRTSTSDSLECQITGADVAPHWRGFMKVLKKGPGARLQHFTPLKNVPKLTRRKSKRVRQEMVPPVLKNPATITSPLDGEFSYFKSTWKNFSQAELRAATNEFSSENLIGQGGYAEVYKGQFPDGQFAAIKRLTKGSPEEMTMDFLSELGIIVHVDHPNIARVIGYGVEGGMHLVLQLSPHGSLASILYGPKEMLDWATRYKVALGTAEGLVYLHEGCQRRIIHKDIKAANILLTEDFEPQISDFGLAKWLPDQWTHHTVSKIEGTFGYLPPEFFMHGIVDEKTDVFAFGVLLLELITGRQALDSSQQSLVMWAKPKLDKDNIKELVDPVIGNAYDTEQMKRTVLTASMCVHQDSMNRPVMSQVVQILRGDKASFEMFRQCQKSKLQRTYSEELLDAEEYNSTKYLSDMNLHMDIVLSQFDEV